MLKKPQSDEERFWSKVEMIPFHDCWEWIAGKYPHGYGMIGIKKKKTTVSAHRISYQMKYGPIPEGLQVNHKCDNPGCVRPEHLYAGTQKENIRDVILRGRNFNQKKTHCLRGHEFNAENTEIRIRPNKTSRFCLKCRFIHAEGRERRRKSQSEKGI